MRKYINIVIMIMFITLLAASDKPQLARLHYDGGGDWYNDPDIIPNITNYINRTIGSDFSETQAVVKPSDQRIYDHPFIFMTGHGNIAFSERDINNLRRYLLRGGFLYADDDYGMDEAFRREIKKVFPERDLIELPADHEIFHCFYSFPNGIPKIHEHDGKRPQAFAIFDDHGRMMVFYTYETNISDGWSDAHDNPPEIRDKAFRMGANLFYYMLIN